jgi:hypothetical protein
LNERAGNSANALFHEIGFLGRIHATGGMNALFSNVFFPISNRSQIPLDSGGNSYAFPAAAF